MVRRRALRPLLLFCLITPSATADWISLSGAENSPTIIEMHVASDHVRLVLEIFDDDLLGFVDLLPDASVENVGSDLVPLRVLADGVSLSAAVQVHDRRERIDRASPFKNIADLSRIPFSRPPDNPFVTYMEVTFPFTGHPETLSIIPPLKPSGYPTATIGFIAFHLDVPVIDFRYLSGEEGMQLSWEDPWYSQFDNPNLSRHHSSPLMSFLYVEPHEVRHEVLVRVKDLGNWMDLDLRAGAIEVNQLEDFKSRVGDFMLTRNPVSIDGEPGRPILDRVNFVSVGLQGIQVVEQPQSLDTATAIVGVILAFITEGMPDEVTVDWDLFSDDIQKVPTMATDPAGPFSSFVTVADSRLVWQNFLQNYEAPTIKQVEMARSFRGWWAGFWVMSVIAIALLWRAVSSRSGVRWSYAVLSIVIAVWFYPQRDMAVDALAPEEARRVVAGLLQNIYRAFDFRREADVYDKLAISVSGDLLADVYLQNRRSMEIENQGGARARVETVQLLSIVAVKIQSGEQAYRCVWTASGAVGHWGHVHRRKNRYEAILKVNLVAGAWKLTWMELLDELRVNATRAVDAVGRE